MKLVSTCISISLKRKHIFCPGKILTKKLVFLPQSIWPRWPRNIYCIVIYLALRYMTLESKGDPTIKTTKFFGGITFFVQSKCWTRNSISSADDLTSMTGPSTPVTVPLSPHPQGGRVDDNLMKIWWKLWWQWWQKPKPVTASSTWYSFWWQFYESFDDNDDNGDKTLTCHSVL